MDYKLLAQEFIELKMAMPNPPDHDLLTDEVRGERGVIAYLITVKDGATPGELASFGNVSTARMANILAALEKKGIITRKIDSNDRRKSIVNITEQGRIRGAEYKSHGIQELSKFLEFLGEHDAKELLRLLRRGNEYRRKL